MYVVTTDQSVSTIVGHKLPRTNLLPQHEVHGLLAGGLPGMHPMPNLEGINRHFTLDDIGSVGSLMIDLRMVQEYLHRLGKYRTNYCAYCIVRVFISILFYL